MRKSLKFALIFIVIVLYNFALLADDYPRNPNIDILHYVFKIDLSDDTNSITGNTLITALIKSDNLNNFTLDMIGKTGTGYGMVISAIIINDEQVRFEHNLNKLKIYFNETTVSGQKIKIEINYSGIPEDGLIISKNKYGERTFFGDNWPNRARHWLPSLDHPYDKATCEFIITAPSHYQVIANGLQIEETNLEDNKRLTHWKQSVKIPTYLMVIGVAGFAVSSSETYKNISIQSWVYPQDRDKGFHDFGRSKRIIEFFDQRIGEYPYEKLANVQSKTRYGGMENASVIFYSENAITGVRRNENTVVHEIAHQWFGDSVTEEDWHHVWLSEGFATYFTHVFNEFTYGRDRMVSGLKQNMNRIFRFYDQNPDSPIVDKKITVLTRLLNANSYQKGGWVLHMLRGVIGDEAFWEGIRNYYSEYRNSNALTEDLRRTMEESSETDLKWFFDQWIYQPGQPEYSGSWEWLSDKKEVRITLNQVQDNGILFKMPLEIGFIKDGNKSLQIEKVNAYNRKNTFIISVGSEPSNVVLDPNTWVLMKVREFRKK